MTEAERIRGLVAKHFTGPLDSVWVGGDIPARKSRNARASHVLPEGESLLVVYDDTVFGSASDGVVITTERISAKDLFENPRAVRYDQVTPEDIQVDGKALKVGGLVLDFKVTWTPAHAQCFAAFLREATARTRLRSDWSANTVTARVRNRFGGDDDAYFPPTIPAHKEANVRALFRIPDDEPLVALFDDTVFGSATEGWVMTPRRFAFCQSFGTPRQMAWLDVLLGPISREGPGVRMGAFFHEPLQKARTPILLATLEDLKGLREGLEPRNAQLDERIARDPRDEEAFAVYADWLLEQGHPRGLLQGPRTSGVEQQRILSDYAPELGLLWSRDDVAEVTWRWGFWDRITLWAPEPPEDSDGIRPDALAAQILRHPSARFARTLVIGGSRPVESGRLEPLLAAVAAVELPCLQHLDIHGLPGSFVSNTLDLTRYPHLISVELEVSRVDATVQRAVDAVRAR